MTRTHLSDADFSIIANFEATTFNNLKTKLNEHDTALDSVGAPSVATETVTSGNLTVSVETSYLSVTGTQAYTLPDGAAVGEKKIIECSVAASTPVGTLTITTPNSVGSEPATHVFTAVGQRLSLIWLSTGWHVTGKTRAGQQAVVIGTTVLTGYDMCRTYTLSVTGTVHSTGTKGIPSGCVPGEQITIWVSSVGLGGAGDIDITATTNVGVAADNWGDTGTAINATTAAIGLLTWDGTTWQASAAAITATLA